MRGKTRDLKTQEVLRGRVFDLEFAGMRKMIEIVTFQSWEHFFEPLVPTLQEKEVRIFYHSLTFSDDVLYLTTQVCDNNIALDEEVLNEILGVPTERIKFLDNQSGPESY